MKSRNLFGLLLSAALAFSTAPSLAQSPAPEAQEGAQIALEEMRSRLGLSGEQEAQIRPLVDARNAKLKELLGSRDSSASRREKISTLRQARSIQQDFVEQVEPLLSKEQKKEWEKMREEMRATAKERLREKRGG